MRRKEAPMPDELPCVSRYSQRKCIRVVEIDRHNVRLDIEAGPPWYWWYELNPCPEHDPHGNAFIAAMKIHYAPKT